MAATAAEQNKNTTENIKEENTQPEQPKKDKLTLLKEGLETNPKNAIELAAFYKDLLIKDRKDKTARKGLKELREWYIKNIALAFATEDADLARELIDMVKQSFPRVTKVKRFIRLEKKVAFLERINHHFAKAEKYFNAGALSKPINQNALHEVNKILILSPNNEDAKNFVKKIVDSYLQKTTQLQEQGNIHNAILMVEEGIAAINNESRLVKKRKQLKLTIKHNKAVSSLFKKARKYLAADQLIRPIAYNAYDVYQQILKKEDNNLEAKAAIKSIHQLLTKKITAAIHKGNLKISSEYLQAAIQRYGRTPLLAGVQLKLNDALDVIAPKIEVLKLSASPVSSLIKNNPKNLTLNLHHTLYAGFNFLNFDIKTTWLEVTLFDKSRKIKVTQKPIVISSQAGEHFFEVNLPAKGFSNSRYKIEIKLKNRVLASKSFLVKD